jgi:hypothetical protein
LAISGARIAEAVFGAVVGITVNAVIRPPVYLRDTRAALQDAAREAQAVLLQVGEGLAQGEWHGRAAGGWHERALRLGRLVEQARSSIGWSRESMRGNHRRRGPHGVAPPGGEYDDALAVLDHVAVHVAGMTRTVLEIARHHDEAARLGTRITGPYADFLHHAGRAIGLYGQTRFAETDVGPGARNALRGAAEELRRSLDELHRRLPGTVQDDPGTLAANGTLLAHARRLAEQLVPDPQR